jgi:spermidine/putrescine transport system permease protein
MSRNPQEKVRPKPPRLVIGILVTVLVFLYMPLLIMVFNSLIEKTDDGLVASFRWYREIFLDEALIEAMGRSLFVGLTSAAIATGLGSMAALAVARSQFRFRLPLEVMSFVSLIIPELVFALSLLSWFFILHIQLSLFTVIAAHVTFCLSFVMITMGSRISTLDISIEDAARDLGASEFRILKSVTLPLLLPAIGASFVLSFLLSFDDFLITFYTNGVGSDTLPIKLYGAMKIGITPKLSAMSTLMFFFTLALILFGLRGRAIRDLVGVKE